MLKNPFTKQATPAEQVAEIERQLAEARGALDTAWKAYGAASAEALAAGGSPSKTREQAALNAATQRVSELEAALDHAREQRAEGERQEADKAARARIEQQCAAGAALAAAVDAFEPAADAMAVRAKAVFDALEGFIAISPEAMHSRMDMNLGLSAVINYRLRFVPGVRQRPFMDDASSRLAHYLPYQVRPQK
jgi:exonuclease VII large subunit